MSNANDAYKQAMKQNYEWQKVYLQNVPQDTGITSPEGYNVYPDPRVPYVLESSALQKGAVPSYTNPAAMLYRSGDRNVMLLGAHTNQCDTGCVVPITKPDPRVFQVKPLYQPHIFKPAKGQTLPTAYNVVGMY